MLYKYINYILSLLKADYMPFLIRKWSPEEVSKYKQFINKGLNEDYKSMLYLSLKQYYGKNFELFLFNSGRSALFFFLKSLNLDNKSQVILPSYSCYGLIEPIIRANLLPHFVDINDDLNISFNSVKKSINKNTKVIIIPHLGGKYASDTGLIYKIARKNKIIVIEDSCQAFGLKIDNKPIGTNGDFAFFSAGEGKPLFSSGGGWLIMRKKKINLKKQIKLESTNYKEQIHRIKNFKLKYTTNLYARVYRRVIDNFKTLIMYKIFGISLNTKPFIFADISNFEAYLCYQELKLLKKSIMIKKMVSSFWKKNLKSNSKIDVINMKNSISNKFYINVTDLATKQKIILSGVEAENGYKPLHLRFHFDTFPSAKLNYTEKVWKNILALPNQYFIEEKKIKLKILKFNSI